MWMTLPHSQHLSYLQQHRYYIRMLHKVIDEADEADVILIVLDARDPPGCRSRLVW